MKTLPSSEPAGTRSARSSPSSHAPAGVPPPPRPTALAAGFRALGSLRLTLVLLGFSIALVFAATLDQVNLGVWGIQEKWFRSWVVFGQFGNLVVPVFPGGYSVGGVLLLNLVAAHFRHFTPGWRQLGIMCIHGGLLVLLIGELLSGIWQEDYFLRVDTGETRRFAESSRVHELAVIDVSDPALEHVTAIPESRLADPRALAVPGIPFTVEPRDYFANATLARRPPDDPAPSATRGLGRQLRAIPRPAARRDDEGNLPAAHVELRGAEGPLGTFLVSPGLAASQEFEYGGRRWSIALRPRRIHGAFALTLLEFRHDRYPGTEIPRNFSSRLRLATPDGREDREVLISMNNPLRHDGLTFYQAGFENADRTSVLQVVRNPSWALPYVACALMSFGLTFQFTSHLLGFLRRRRAASGAAAAPSPPRPAPANRPSASARPASDAGRWFVPVVLGVVLLAVAVTLRPRRHAGAFDLTGFAALPTLAQGRHKPLDTTARVTLLTLQGRQRVVRPGGTVIPPAAWLLEMCFRPAEADRLPVFEITHPQALAALSLEPAAGAGGKRFSLAQLRPALRELDRQARLADAAPAAERSAVQDALIRVRNNVALYQRVQSTFLPPDVDDFLTQVLARHEPAGIRLPRAPASPEELQRWAAAIDGWSLLAPIPSRGASASATGWRSFGRAVAAGVGGEMNDPVLLDYARLGEAWRDQDAASFNQAVARLRAQLGALAPRDAWRARIEAHFNAAQPFQTSLVLYVVAFLVAVVSWLWWPDALRRIAFHLVAIGFALTTAGMLARMWLEARPPVTNLYSSALFVGWAAVGLCLLLERLHRNALGSAAAGLIGFAALVIAHHLSLGGDTLEMMRAVLDSNFWLATHVVTITVGYAATFLAGALAILCVLRGVGTRSLDRATADTTQRMIYGIVCFATFFSLVGTVLGGIWADQSWGRFWGWDPKENGALILVLWNALILHARWAGLVKLRGLLALVIGGDVVTAWSWFGVNMLGVGLHSYGFMDAAFWWLVAFVASQVALIALAAVPAERWRSRAAVVAT